MRLLLRNWRSGEVKILSGALILAVAVVTAITVFANRMELSLERQSNSFLAADRVVSSRFDIPQAWLSIPEQYRLQQAKVVSFNSMVFAGDDMHLAAVKAVSENYPLRGNLEVSDKAFAVGTEVVVAEQVPASGEVWVDSRLLALLGIQLGDVLAVGESDFRVTKVVIREPDQTSGFSVMGPRVLMNVADLAATEVILPGSRIKYRWLLAGEAQDLTGFEKEILPLLGEHYRLRNVRDSQQNINSTLDRGSNFLLLAGMIAMLLASVAIAISAQQFSERHVDQVALLKSLGASSWQIRKLYFMQISALAIIASAIGLLLGNVLQEVIASSIISLFKVELLDANLWSYATGVATGLLCLLFFALPPLWYLPTVSPLKVLRREMPVNTVQLWGRGLAGLFAIVLLVFAYSRNLTLTLAVVAGLTVLISVAAVMSLVFLKTGRKLGMKAGSVWRLALASLERHKGQSVTQIIVFACAFMLLMVIVTLRTSLIDEWQLQLPADAPNHFIVNVSAQERVEIEAFFKQHSFQLEPFYPMVLGRVAEVNDQPISEQLRSEVNALRRELNLSWAENLAADNKLIQGQWWDTWQSPTQSGLAGVSVEQSVAEDMQLALGDKINFSIGGLKMQAEVASIRTLDWESMRPNFYFLFSPGALKQFTPNFMTSLYIPSHKKAILNHLLRDYPTIVVIEADRIIERIRNIVEQVSRVIELILWLVLVGGFFVLASAVHASIYTRLQEAGLLRALGSGKRLIMGSLWVEFATLGLFSGLLAVIGGEALLVALQTLVFKQPVSFHFYLWFYVPLLSVITVGGFGVYACRKVISVPPAVVLREL
ncbi:ABC transporter permease [Dasania phycosphaerae]|nr:FtsX-like permease family protein [Dasania phycosphaerae]